MRTVGRKTSTSSIKAFVITVAFIFLFTVALLLDIQYLYFMAVMAALIQPIAYGIVALAPTSYSGQRRHISSAVEGKPLRVTLELSAQGRFPATTLEVDEVLPSSLPRTDEPLMRKPESWDGYTGTLTYTVEPLLRGVHTLGPTRVETTDPLGLFSFSADLAPTTEVVVHPSPLTVRVAQSGGEGRFGVREREGKAQRGDGLEFHGVREYHPGDSLRRVHWRTTARTGRLAVVEFEKAFEQDLVIALDLTKETHVGSGRESTLEYAVKIAATLADRTATRGGGVMLFTQTGKATLDARSSDPEAARYRLFDQLARAQATADVSLAATLSAQQFRPGTRLVVLTAAGDPALDAWLTRRLSLGDSLEVYYLDPLSFGGRATRLPGVPPTLLKRIEKKHSPWEEGGKHLEPILRESR
jgi:uncharacterized protein (DUF58 family)